MKKRVEREIVPFSARVSSAQRQTLFRIFLLLPSFFSSTARLDEFWFLVEFHGLISSNVVLAEMAFVSFFLWGRKSPYPPCSRFFLNNFNNWPSRGVVATLLWQFVTLSYRKWQVSPSSLNPFPSRFECHFSGKVGNDEAYLIDELGRENGE